MSAINTPHLAMRHALEEVAKERVRQEFKWGEQNHDFGVWALIHDEEWGEFSHAVLHWRAAAGLSENVEGDGDPDAWVAKMRNEAVQTAAVMVAIVEFIDRGMKPTPVVQDAYPVHDHGLDPSCREHMVFGRLVGECIWPLP